MFSVRSVSVSQFLVVFGLLLFAVGCGTAVQKIGTEQLLLSDSVDRAIDQLDLSPLAGRTVFLDTAYMQTFKGPNVYINSDYIVSALRQKMTTTGCRMELNRTEADYVLEARVGALGTDTMEVTYGIPSSNGIGIAATAITGVPAVPAIPELSVGKRNNMMGVSKIVVFAYHRDTGIPVWQSGAAVSRSDAKDSWFMGVGPLTRGSVYNGVTLAGNRVNSPFDKKSKSYQAKPLTIADRHSYVHPAVLEKQLADAKAVEAQQKLVEQATPAAGDAAATATTAATETPTTATPTTATPTTETPTTATASATATASGESTTAIGDSSPVPAPETGTAVKQVSDTKTGEVPFLLFDGETLPPVPPAE